MKYWKDVSGEKKMDILSAINNSYSVVYKMLRASYRTLSLRRWVVKHSSGGG